MYKYTSGERRRRAAIAALGGIVYLLRDKFGFSAAAGSVNGTTADPTGQTRTVTDTNNKLSITGGVASFATGGVGVGDPGLWYPAMTRRVGQVYLSRVTNSGAAPSHSYNGWFNGATSSFSNIIFFISNQIRWNSGVIVGVNAPATEYNIAIIQRTAGAWFFIKGGAFTNWSLLYVSTAGVGGEGEFPGVIAGGVATVATADDIRIPDNLYIPSPLAYDTFTRANGALGSTETTGPDSQVLSALAWAFAVGIWTIATNKAVGTPATFGADVIVNGGFAADTNWTKGAGWTIAAGVATGTAATGDLTAAVAPLTANRWFKATYTISGYTGGGVYLLYGGAYYSTVRSANGTYTEYLRNLGTSFAIRVNTAFTGNIDNVSAQVMTMAELFASVTVATADVVAEVAITIDIATTDGYAGLVLNLDSSSNPQNFIIACIKREAGGGILTLDECVGGVLTNKIWTSITYSAGAVLRVVRDGTSCRVFYNNLAVGTVQTMTANTNVNHGLLSTNPENTLDAFQCWARGAAGEYAALDAY